MRRSATTRGDAATSRAALVASAAALAAFAAASAASRAAFAACAMASVSLWRWPIADCSIDRISASRLRSIASASCAWCCFTAASLLSSWSDFCARAFACTTSLSTAV